MTVSTLWSSASGSDNDNSKNDNVRLVLSIEGDAVVASTASIVARPSLCSAGEDDGGGGGVESVSSAKEEAKVEEDKEDVTEEAEAAEEESGKREEKKEKSTIIKLVISKGNVFHPHSNLILISPLRSIKKEENDVVVRISENNLFEEGCNVIIDLNLIIKENNNKEEEEEEQVQQIIGPYNLFAPKSCITCGSIGSGNVFEAACDVRSHFIGNGNVFGPTIIWDTLTTTTTTTAQQQGVSQQLSGGLEKVNDNEDGNNNANRKDDELKDGTSIILAPPMDKTVVYATQNALVDPLIPGIMAFTPEEKESIGQKLIRTRRHINGTEKNVRDIQAILPTIQYSIRKHHQLMKSTSSADSDDKETVS